MVIYPGLYFHKMIYSQTTNLSCFLHIIKKGILLKLLKIVDPVLWKFIKNIMYMYIVLIKAVYLSKLNFRCSTWTGRIYPRKIFEEKKTDSTWVFKYKSTKERYRTRTSLYHTQKGHHKRGKLKGKDICIR